MISLTWSTGALLSVAERLHMNGEGSVAMGWVDDLFAAYETAVARGATAMNEPLVMRDCNGCVWRAEVGRRTDLRPRSQIDQIPGFLSLLVSNAPLLRSTHLHIRGFGSCRRCRRGGHSRLRRLLQTDVPIRDGS